MRKRDLEIFLEKIPMHPSPKLRLEQYTTPVTVVSRILWIAFLSFGDIGDKIVLDLGAGTGRFGLGALLLGAKYVVLLDIDLDALAIAWKFAKNESLGGKTDVIVGDVKYMPFRCGVLFDTVLQNPPFGVHKKGIDIIFVEKACKVSRTVYTIHKKSTLDFLLKHFEGRGFKVEVLYSDKLCIPPIFNFHFEKKHCVEIVVLRIKGGNNGCE